MTRRGRPPLPEPVIEIYIHLRLRPGEDDDLLAFFERYPARRRATALKTALRAGGLQTAGSQDAVDDDDLSAVDGLLF